MGNQALNINPPAGSAHDTVNGSDWLWAVMAVFTVSFIGFWALSHRARYGERVFHYLFTVAALVGVITYFALASDVGYTVVTQVNSINYYGASRQIFFSKYIYWVVSFPTLIIALGLISGVSWATIIYNIFLSWIWIVSYLISAYTVTNYKWGFYAFGTVAWLLLAHSTLGYGMPGANRVGIARDHHMLAGWVNFIWLMYPICFGLSDGGNRIGVVASLVWFGILDLLLIPVVGFAFIFLSRTWDYGRLNLAFTQYGRVNAPGGTFPEKNTAGAVPAGGVATGDQAV